MTHKSADDLKRDDINPMRKFTTQELLDELTGRDGVELFDAHHYYLVANMQSGETIHNTQDPATIIVVRKP